MQEKIEYIIEYRGPNKKKYSKYFSGFNDKEFAYEIAEIAKKSSPELGVRIVKQTRKVIKVFNKL
jgi:hypothetical protein